jgi:hypothetical protein
VLLPGAFRLARFAPAMDKMEKERAGCPKLINEVAAFTTKQ